MHYLRTKSANLFTHYGSLATDPICSVHKHVIKLTLTKNRIYPKSSYLYFFADKVNSLVRIILLLPLAVPLGAAGITFRFIANVISPDPFIFRFGSMWNFEKDEMNIISRENPTIFKWNICGIGGGYPTYQNGLKPWDERFNQIVDKIKEQDADILFLEEVYDYKLGNKLFKALKNNYRHFYFNINPKAVGAPSGQFIASRIPTSNPRVKSFPSSSNIGRIKFVGKCLFGIDIGNFSFYHTHLQHSENEHNPTTKEIEERKKQAKIILKEISKTKNSNYNVLLGDLNMTPKELKKSPLMRLFQSPPNLGTRSYFPVERASKELKTKREIKNEGSFIDYILLQKSYRSITTKLIKTFSLRYPERNISDHHGLFSRINNTPLQNLSKATNVLGLATLIYLYFSPLK